MRRQQNGLSLIELMISITLGLVLMTGVVQMFLTSRETFTTQQAVSRIQESGRLAMEFMARDIRMAGYMGCSSRNPENIEYGLEPNTDHQFEFGVGIEGYTDADNPLGDDVAKDDTDVLVVRRASEDQARLISGTTPPSANVQISGTEVNDCAGGICKDGVAVLSDCTQGRIFRVVNLQTTGSGDINVVHSGGGSSPKNADNPSQLGGQYFAPGAEVLGVKTVTYYIAPSSFNADSFSLWQNVMGESAELIEGVDDMVLRYGSDTDGDNIPDSYDAAGSVSNWDDISAVRIHLVVQSNQANVVQEPQPYILDGATVDEDAIIGDRRMRQVFTSTVGIRSRLD